MVEGDLTRPRCNSCGYVQYLNPGDSIQAAIDRSRDGGTVYLNPGVYREVAPTPVQISPARIRSTAYEHALAVSAR